MSMPGKVLWLAWALVACTEPGPAEPEPTDQGIALSAPFGNLPGRPFAVAVGPDGRVLVTQQDYRRVTRVGPARTAPRTRFEVSEVPGDVVLTPDGSIAIVSCLYGGRLHFILLETGEQIDSLQVGINAYRMVLSTDAADLFVTTTGGKVFRVDVASGEKADSVQLAGSLQGIARRADGRIAVSSEGGAITLLDQATLDPIASAEIGGHAQDIAFSPDGTLLFVAQEWAQRVAVLDGASLAMIDEIFFGHMATVAPFGLALSPDGLTLVVTGSATSNVAVIATATLEVTEVVPVVGGNPRRIAFAPDGKTAYIADEGGRLDVLRVP